jgi:hypothetical protein
MTMRTSDDPRRSEAIAVSPPVGPVPAIGVRYPRRPGSRPGQPGRPGSFRRALARVLRRRGAAGRR